MTKTKSKDIGNIQVKKCGKNIYVPKEVCPVIKKLDELSFVKHIQTGNFRNSNNGSGIEIVGYDDRTRKYKINIRTKSYLQIAFLDVQERKPEYEPLIKKCF